jgi:hypothetical protein
LIRLATVLVVAAVGVSGCAVGIAGNPSYITGTGASINGKVFSNSGGPTEYWVRYGKTTAYGQETPHQTGTTTGSAPKTVRRAQVPAATTTRPSQPKRPAGRTSS